MQFDKYVLKMCDNPNSNPLLGYRMCERKVQWRLYGAQPRPFRLSSPPATSIAPVDKKSLCGNLGHYYFNLALRSDVRDLFVSSNRLWTCISCKKIPRKYSQRLFYFINGD